MGIKSMGIRLVNVREAACGRCGYKWLPRKPGRPRKCANCHDPAWDKKRIYRPKGSGKKRTEKKGKP
ncbi:MAG: hypothetical protein O7H41_15115 [Planctomycetota bacterium]|nr:hypothetical protein [Planctomycetota bacterium]